MLAKSLYNEMSLHLIMRRTVQKSIWEVVGYEGSYDYNSSEGSGREVEEVENSSEAAIVRSYREANLKRMSREEKLDWLAGYIDGDGCVSTVWRKDRGGRWHRQVYVASIDFSVVQSVSELMAEFGIFGRIYERGRNRRLYYTWSIQDRKNLVRFVRIFANRLCTSNKLSQLTALVDSLKVDVDVSVGSVTLPWIAGFFEAEGCISCSFVRERGTKVVLVSITQSDKDILMKILNVARACGVERCYIYKRKNRHVWVLYIQGPVSVRSFIDLVGRYILSDSKIIQLFKAEQFMENWNIGYKQTSWLPEICNTALELHKRGIPYSKIARILNARFGTSLSGDAVWIKLRRMREVRGYETK